MALYLSEAGHEENDVYSSGCNGILHLHFKRRTGTIQVKKHQRAHSAHAGW